LTTQELNDFYGHQCGDHVHHLLAKALQRYIEIHSKKSNSRPLPHAGKNELAIWTSGNHSEARACRQELR